MKETNGSNFNFLAYYWIKIDEKRYNDKNYTFIEH